jgi:hypothetical protein
MIWTSCLDAVLLKNSSKKDFVDASIMGMRLSRAQALACPKQQTERRVQSSVLRQPDLNYPPSDQPSGTRERPHASYGAIRQCDVELRS